MRQKTDDQLLSEAKEWLWWFRYSAAWWLPRWLSRIVQPQVFSDEAIQRALSSGVKPLFPPPPMSGYEGRADVVCQELSGPFIARRRHWRLP